MRIDIPARSSERSKPMPLVLEGLVATLDATGGPHLAPMGPNVPGAEFDRFVLRPFPTSQTYQNLRVHGEGVLHVTDDVLLMAQAAIGRIQPHPDWLPAERIRGWVLKDCCRFFEFRVVHVDDSRQRAEIEVEVEHSGQRRPFFGFNRAKHAVLEAAILATRVALLPLHEIIAEFQRFESIVAKTGGAAEIEALALLNAFVRGHGNEPESLE